MVIMGVTLALTMGLSRMFRTRAKASYIGVGVGCARVMNLHIAILTAMLLAIKVIVMGRPQSGVACFE